MNQNNDRGNTSSTAAFARPGDKTNTNLNANAGNPGQDQAFTQNQPQNQNLQPQQQQHQNLKPNPPQGGGSGNQPVPGKEDRAGSAQVANQQGEQGTSNRQDNSNRQGQPGNPSQAKDASARPGTQGQSDASGHSDAECQEAMKKMEAAGAPGPAHKALEPLVGNWKAEVKCWKDAGGEPHTSQGTASAKWILNGRFLQEEFSGEMMGKPFKGLTLLGYDNTKQTYNSVWMADTQTSIFTSEGKGGNNKEITLEGEANCPINGPQKVKSVYGIVDQNKHVFEMYNGGNKALEVTYTRQ